MNFENLKQNKIDRLADEELADNFEHEKIIEKQFEKPQKLYRGMSKKNIQEFDPSLNKKYRDGNEGSVIFATPDKAFASMFLVPEMNDGWTNKGKFGDVYYIVIGSEEHFRKFDNGGSIYEIDNFDDFYCDEKKGMGDCEWVSRDSVKPSSEELVESALDTMIENGVQVYFVDKEVFIKIHDSSDHGLTVLQNMQSENQKQGKNIKKLTDND
ncbi:MAG: hypothetical protein ACKUBY_04130 [Candidatus Moraniibacteriota bacterium]|jgi:hypothetical protein